MDGAAAAAAVAAAAAAAASPSGEDICAENASLQSLDSTSELGSALR